MLQPSHIRFKKRAQIGNTVFQHCQSVHTDPERKPLILVGVNAAGPQNVRMNHTAAENLQPIVSGADFQLCFRFQTADIHFCRGLGKRKIRRTITNRKLVQLKESLYKVIQAAFQMRHGNILVNHQTLDLVEHRGMRGIIIRTISPARRNNPYRRTLVLHRPYLHRRSLRSDHITVIKIRTLGIGNIERVLHLACRMIGRRIQRIKVMELVFDIRPFGNIKPHLPENGYDFFINFAHRMNTPLILRTNRQADVNRFAGKFLVQLLFFQNGFLSFQRGLHFRLQNIEGLPCFLLFFNRQTAERLHHLGNPSFFAQNGNSDLLQRFNVGGLFHGCQKFGF